MTTTTDVSRDQVVEVCGLKLHLLQEGTGDPVVVLHHDIGPPGWLPLYGQLAQDYTVRAPDLPGYGQSERMELARSPRDLAIILQLLLDKLEVRSTALVGLGFGGWIAAEMATMGQQRFTRLVLVGAMGLLPPEGEILDQIMISHQEYVETGFADRAAFERVFGSEVSDEQQVAWDLAREMTARITWKPYMYSHQLPQLLTGVTVPTLVVWGRQDRIVPLSCGERYAQLLPNARLEVLDDAGHFIDLERPEELARLVAGHLSGR